jgi:hypothetical protein
MSSASDNLIKAKTSPAPSASPGVQPNFCTAKGIVDLKEATHKIGSNGNLVINRDGVRLRVRHLLICAKGFDIASQPMSTPFPNHLLGPTQRIGLKGAINNTWFDDVECRIGVESLAASKTPTAFVSAVFASCSSWHKSPPY